MTHDAHRHVKRNFRLGVTNGFFFMAGASLLGPAVVLPQFLSTIFESKTAIGIGSTLGMMGWCLPQVLVAYFLRSVPRKKTVYIVGNFVRMGAIGAFVLAFYLLRGDTRAVGILYFVFFIIAGLAAGTVGLAYQDIVARAIPSERRGSFNAYRAFFGQGVIALAVGAFARYVLNHPEKFPYPGNYLLLFFIAWIMMVVGVIVFSNLKEPVESSLRPRPRFKHYLFELYIIVKRDPVFRRYLFCRFLRTCSLVAAPFYIVYARERLHLPEGAAGVFLIVGVVATIPAALIWGKLADRYGSRHVIIRSGLTSAAAPLLALLIVALASAGAFDSETVRFAGLSVSREKALIWIVAPVFALLRASQVGTWIGFDNFIMDTAPARRRPLYLGLATSLVGVVVLVMPAIGGIAIDLGRHLPGGPGYPLAFAAAAVLLILSTLTAKNLHEPRNIPNA